MASLVLKMSVSLDGYVAPLEIPKVVFSNSLTSADWPETTIATGDLTAAVAHVFAAHP